VGSSVAFEYGEVTKLLYTKYSKIAKHRIRHRNRSLHSCCSCSHNRHNRSRSIHHAQTQIELKHPLLFFYFKSYYATLEWLVRQTFLLIPSSFYNCPNNRNLLQTHPLERAFPTFVVLMCLNLICKLPPNSCPIETWRKTKWKPKKPEK
jgi:hypothetical protein